MTMRQLIICVVGGGLTYVLYTGLGRQPMEIWLPPVLVVGGLTAAIAFLKINEVSFVQYVLFALERFLIEKRRHWRPMADTPLVLDAPAESTQKAAAEPAAKPQKNIDDLTRMVDAQLAPIQKTTAKHD